MTKAQQPAAQPVAWLYRHKAQPWKQACVVQRMDSALEGADEWHEYPLCIAAHPAEQPAAQPDIVLVPREPTPEMLEAAAKVSLDEPQWDAAIYRAMLAAAPQQPTAQPVAWLYSEDQGRAKPFVSTNPPSSFDCNELSENEVVVTPLYPHPQQPAAQIDPANEVERLRDELNSCCELKRTYLERWSLAADRCCDLHAEVERLRAQQPAAQPVAWMYEGVGDITKGRVIARTPAELDGDVDLYPHAWKRTVALYTHPHDPQEVMRLAEAWARVYVRNDGASAVDDCLAGGTYYSARDIARSDEARAALARAVGAT